MRAFAPFITILAIASCRPKSGSDSSGSAGGSAMEPKTGSDVTVTPAVAGSATAGSAGAGSASAGSGDGLDPKFASLSAEERHTCGIYATCKVEGLRDDDPHAADKKPAFENACLAVWVKLSAADKQKIASCADKVGQCLGPPPCFDSMKL